MRKVGEVGHTEIAIIRPDDINFEGGFNPAEVRVNGPELAAGMNIVYRDGYANRFALLPDAAADNLAADPFDPAHINDTLGHIGRSPEEGGYWTVATDTRLRALGYLAVEGLAWCTVDEREVFVADLHTHPHAQKRGIGSATLQAALAEAAKDPRVIQMGDEAPLGLFVARQPVPESGDPAPFYRSLGFVDTGETGRDFIIGNFSAPRYRMVGNLAVVQANLHARTGFDPA